MLHEVRGAPLIMRVCLCTGVAGQATWVTVVAEQESPLDAGYATATELLLLCYMDDVKSRLAVHHLGTGELVRALEIPLGQVTGVDAKRSSTEVFFKFVGFLEPGVVMRVEDITCDAAPVPAQRTALSGGIDLAAFETKQIFFQSDDGTSIPMFVVHKKGLVLDGSNPTLLYG
jgi:prolyl oligopeptidase